VGEFDLIIRGGAVVDGSGTEPRACDVGIVQDRIRATGDLASATATRVIPADGQLVFPGFIDAHSHADGLLGSASVQEAYLRQGVTSVILGQDGVSFAPTDASAARYSARYFAAVNGPAPPGFEQGGSVANLLASWDETSSLNAGYLVPAGTVRAQFVGLADDRATPVQLDAMCDAVANALHEGALGLSTGLDYLPGAFATTDELAALCVPVASAGGVYVSHLRGYATDTIGAALDEAAAISQRSGARAHVSHLHGAAAPIEEQLARYHSELDVQLSFDSYPYLKGATLLAMIALPAELQASGPASALARLADASVRHRLRTVSFPANSRLASVTLAFLSAPELRWAEGMSLAAAATEQRKDLVDFVCDALIACELAVGCVVDNGSERTEEDLRRLLRHPSQLASSDAIFLGSHPHPRGWGAFARLLARHVRELGDWSWGEAGYHLSGHAARRFGLADRGSIEPGAIADLVILDPAVVTDTATYDEPMSAAVGVSHVVVGGRLVLDDGDLTGVRAGRGLRRASGQRA
jgi:N-acyl-D-amino-acid deacylase